MLESVFYGEHQRKELFAHYFYSPSLVHLRLVLLYIETLSICHVLIIQDYLSRELGSDAVAVYI
jgi:hypothetical protein